MSIERSSKPWYREPWPWILMSGPAIVVVAGIATAVIAVETNDGLVADDYYKRGLAINKVIARETRAQALGLAATVQFNEERDRVRVLVTHGTPPAEPPRLVLVHATRAGLDQSVNLRPIGAGVYEGPVRIPAEGVWRLQLEDAKGTWRLSGHWRGTTSAVDLAPAL
ncbi:MAG TPA: FixH family protein [Usitatibacter sp.]|nr:FixH family protein [Usitatibacter sp.]